MHTHSVGDCIAAPQMFTAKDLAKTTFQIKLKVGKLNVIKLKDKILKNWYQREGSK